MASLPSPSPSPSPSSTSPNKPPQPAPIPDEEDPSAHLPLPLSASLLLTSLPRDATTALAKAAEHDVDGDVPAKVTIRFQPVGSAPQLRQRVFKISAANRFESVVAFLSRKLKAASSSDRDAGGAGGGRGEGVFCYVNSVFAPGLDEGVGGLWRCFKTDDQLIVSYSMTPAFG